MARARNAVGLLVVLVVAAGIAILLARCRDDDDAVPPAPATTTVPTGSGFSPPAVPPVLAPDAGSVAGSAALQRGVRLASASDPDPVGDGTATLIGRVMLDGQPVTEYGIIVTRHYDVGMFAMPHKVAATDGRFTLERVRAGTWNVMIGAANIARETRTGVKLIENQITDLGDLEVNGGLRITGRVVDGASRPIAGATVAVATSGMSGFTITDAKTGEVLSRPTPQSEALHGRQSVTTDAEGRYQLDGIIPDVGDRRMWITASHPKHGASPRTALPDDNGAIDFVLGATGALDGRITTPLTSPVMVRARRIQGIESGTSMKTDAEGQFRFESLHPGEYAISVGSMPGIPIWQPVTVRVRSNQRASVTFAAPRDAVTVEVELVTCGIVMLRPHNSDQFMDPLSLGAPCRNGLLVLEQVEPGNYSLCRMRECIPITVAKTPARQRIDGKQL